MTRRETTKVKDVAELLPLTTFKYGGVEVTYPSEVVAECEVDITCPSYSDFIKLKYELVDFNLIRSELGLPTYELHASVDILTADEDA